MGRAPFKNFLLLFGVDLRENVTERHDSNDNSLWVNDPNAMNFLSDQLDHHFMEIVANLADQNSSSWNTGSQSLLSMFQEQDNRLLQRRKQPSRLGSLQIGSRKAGNQMPNVINDRDGTDMMINQRFKSCKKKRRRRKINNWTITISFFL